MPGGKFLNKKTGPVLIAVLVDNKNMIYSAHQGFMRLDLLEKADQQDRATLYLFSLKDIDYARKLIFGVSFDYTEKCWVRKEFAFPDALYFRDGVPAHREKEVEIFLKMLRELNSRLVNNLPSFNKWELYQALSKESALLPHLPETKLFRNYRRDLMPMLHKYGKVYLKGCRGRQGRQVLQVKALPGGDCEYRYFDRQPIMRKAAINSLSRIIDDFFGSEKFIVQQPIDLIEIEGSKVDLRAELQRNGTGQLEIVAVSVRTGQKNCPITTHADSYAFDHFFFRMLNYSEAELSSLKERLDQLLLTFFLSIEKHFGSFGEMGIDIGLDKAGKLWFIESNSQPAKVSLMNAYSGKTVTKAFTNPIEYALFLAT